MDHAQLLALIIMHIVSVRQARGDVAKDGSGSRGRGDGIVVLDLCLIRLTHELVEQGVESWRLGDVARLRVRAVDPAQ